VAYPALEEEEDDPVVLLSCLHNSRDSHMMPLDDANSEDSFNNMLAPGASGSEDNAPEPPYDLVPLNMQVIPLQSPALWRAYSMHAQMLLQSAHIVVVEVGLSMTFDCEAGGTYGKHT
jgi:hypothetical protein